MVLIKDLLRTSEVGCESSEVAGVQWAPSDVRRTAIHLPYTAPNTSGNVMSPWSYTYRGSFAHERTIITLFLQQLFCTFFIFQKVFCDFFILQIKVWTAFWTSLGLANDSALGIYICIYVLALMKMRIWILYRFQYYVSLWWIVQ